MPEIRKCNICGDTVACREDRRTIGQIADGTERTIVMLVCPNCERTLAEIYP